MLDKEVTKQFARLRQQIAYLPEAATLYPHLNAYENLSYFLDLAGKKTSQEQLDQALDEVGLQAESRSRHMDNYSKGHASESCDLHWLFFAKHPYFY